jgi:hypothetical protein
MPATLLLALENLGRFDIRKSVSPGQLFRKASPVKDEVGKLSEAPAEQGNGDEVN